MAAANTGITVRPTEEVGLGLVTELATKYGVEANKFLHALKTTVFHQGYKDGKAKPELTNAEIAAGLIVAREYNLNPFTKEIFVFKGQGDKLLIIVSIDGWTAIVNRQTSYNGVEFAEHFEGEKIVSITCKIHRKDRSIPTSVTEYFSECVRSTDPWKQSPIRMLRHKAFMQCARYAFSLGGIMDEDDAVTADPAFAHLPIIEGKSSEELRIDEMFAKLRWDDTKKQAARKAHEGREDALIAYLEVELGKSERATKRTPPPAAKVEQKPAAPSTRTGFIAENQQAQAKASFVASPDPDQSDGPPPDGFDQQQPQTTDTKAFDNF